MVRRVAYLAAVLALGLALVGCALSPFGVPERRAAWHDAEERACIKSRPPVVRAAYVRREHRVNGRGACGIRYPLEVAAFDGGSVQVSPVATLGCPLTTVLEDWMRDAMQPAALAWFGVPVVGIKQLASYSCRSIDSIPGKKLSEHAYGNAIDIAAFVLANGRTVTVERGWHGAPDERSFLREVEASACETFDTTLGPGEPYHGDHFHLDLAHHGRTGTARYCNPKPLFSPPHRPPYGGLYARSNLDWMRTGSIAASTATDVRPPDVVQGATAPLGVSPFNGAVTAPPAYSGN